MGLDGADMSTVYSVDSGNRIGRFFIASSEQGVVVQENRLPARARARYRRRVVDIAAVIGGRYASWAMGCRRV